MKVTKREISIREIVDGFINNDEDGVIGFGGKLNIRPKYQREFVYKDEQRNAVIHTIVRNLPLNVMYWHYKNGLYELIDGQQRTISFCSYISGTSEFIGGFSVNFDGNNRNFHNFNTEEKEQMLNYKIIVFVCEGSDSEVLDWYETINVAGEIHNKQELRNAVYTGEWLVNAKRYFSKTNCPAYTIGKDYLSGSAIRQDYLETILDWISNKNITQYMADHQNDKNSEELWNYFNSILEWIKQIFPTYRKEMKGIEWGHLYNTYKNVEIINGDVRVAELMMDEDVENKKGIYEYILTGKEKYLNVRSFTNTQKRTAYERQGGKCIICGEHFNIDEMEGDHITPWSNGGKTLQENCQMLCKDCNRTKSNR